MNRFERGVLYWHPSHGAHPVVSGILDQWTASGYETGAYGYPTADEVTLQDIARQQQFQNGILYSPKRVAADAAYKDYMQAPAAAQCAAPLGLASVRGHAQKQVVQLRLFRHLPSSTVRVNIATSTSAVAGMSMTTSALTIKATLCSARVRRS